MIITSASPPSAPPRRRMALQSNRPYFAGHQGKHEHITPDQLEYINRDGTRAYPRSYQLTAKAIGVVLGPFMGVKNVAVNRYDVPIPFLPKALDGLKVLQISDLHTYELSRKQYFQQVIDRISEEKPDLIIFSGDLVHQSERCLGFAQSEFLDKLPADVPKIAAMGNHDYKDGHNGQGVIQALKNAGFDVLINQAQPLAFNGHTLWVSALDDREHRMHKSEEDQRRDIEMTFSPVPKNAPHLCVAHNPNDAVEISQSDNAAPFVMSGHTHGGQLNGKGVVNWLRKKWLKWDIKYRAGWYPVENKHKVNLYVHQGTGSVFTIFRTEDKIFTMPELRLGTQAEIAVFKLKSQETESPSK